MKVTKYPQSCLLLEKAGKRIVIDPGSFFVERYKLEDLGGIEAGLYTHQHFDHFDQSLVDRLMERGVKLFGNADVVGLIGTGAVRVQDGRRFSVAGFDILPVDLAHFRLGDGSAGPPNTGYIIDGTFLHPGDGVEVSDHQVPDLGLPIGGPTGDAFVESAAKFAEEVGAKRVIPMHYDYFKPNPHEFARTYGDRFEIHVLDDGESVEF